MKKEIAKRVLGRRLARQIDFTNLGRVAGAGTSWVGTHGGLDVESNDCTENQDTFHP